ncbi:MAG: tRNA 2-thiouridine(34) synthase MnmA [Paludisphaera borealis]|uniref:tRNA 2-thiouridine(34) synthase MnmA n=1 Tax=Paludisphaera borealis TaxID=1387353 RepID=UPI00283D0CCD|nr:tRNA 2-thiouridine(34) synthase MnmA [Paludisphaera borealis]MDR3618562.1 tRNA 2-thiouridine(34) synthase MnmA [Paludisphaera borealis]
MTKPQRVVLAMSGGVDSSVAAYLLKARGYDVVGLFMRTGAYAEGEERRAKTCCSVADAVDAQRVADRLDVPFFVLDFEREFGRIKDYFADEYLGGRTPNPCVMCNIWLKFGRLWEYGKQVGADFVATGHYARIARAADGSNRVARGLDRAKDQSYVLFGLAPELLDRVLFPIGELAKADVRAIAREQNLPVHDKPESQEICFVPDDDYLHFVQERRPDRDTSGTMVDESGQVLGTHAGIEGFTIGQRRGLGIAVGAPRYVVQIEPTTRTITVGKREALAKSGLEASRFNWQGPVPDGPTPCLAQIRAQHTAVPSTVIPLANGEARVVFDSPQTAVTPGQVVAVYQDDLVLGGGWIERATPI